MQVTIRICDICGSKENILEYPDPVGTETDRCLSHVPGEYNFSIPGMYYGGGYPSHEDDIDIQYRWISHDQVQIVFAGEIYNLTRVAVEAMVTASLNSNPQVFGPFTIQTDIRLESGDYIADYFNPDELLAFMDHDWDEGDFEY